MAGNDHLLRVGVLPGFFSPQECERIIALGAAFSQAHVTAGEAGTQVLLSERSTLTSEIADDEANAWIYHRIRDALIAINQQYYRLRLSQFSILQLLCYEPGGFYGMHPDMGSRRFSTRKLSVVVFLSDPLSYGGGELVFYPDMPPVPRGQGQLVVFPSYLMHEVLPVTAGRRHSLVAWAHGPAFA